MPDDALVMIRDNLDDFPQFPPPGDFGIRWHQLGDEQVWVDLQAPFYGPGAIRVDIFYEWFGTDIGAQSQRIAYLMDGAEDPIGTAAAWTYYGFRGPEYGRIHWVAVAGEYQGRGLSKSLMSAVCQRLVELGHTKAYLTTSRERAVAVALYRRFGFRELWERGTKTSEVAETSEVLEGRS